MNHSIQPNNFSVVLSAMQAFRGNRREHIAYVGMPINSGKRFYDILYNKGMKTQEEFVSKFGYEYFFHQVIKPNISEGIKLADKLGSEKKLLFVAPSVFDAKIWQWTQDEYMALWYNVIAEFSGSHFVMNGWEYSIGGLKEVFFSMMLSWRVIRRYNKDTAIRVFGLENLFSGLDIKATQKLFEEMWKIRVYDSDGIEITIDKALSLIVSAILDLRSRGFECNKLIGIALSLKAIPILSPLCYEAGNLWQTDVYFEARETLEKIVRDDSDIILN